MNIGIATRFLHFPGGVETVNATLKKILENNGHCVKIVAGEQFSLSTADRAKMALFGAPFVYRRYFQEEVDPLDLVICNGEFGYGITHRRCIALFHGSAYGYRTAVKKHLGPRSFLRLYQEEIFQKKAAEKKCVVCVSDFLKELYQKQGVKVDHVIDNAIDFNIFTKQKRIKKSDRYLFVGSLDFIGKGFDILQVLAEKGLEIDCVTQKKPTENLGWLPQRPNHEMPTVYSQYKMLLFPSRFEGMSVTPLEAMACGLPVVISPVGLGPKLKKWIPEFVCNSYDPEEYIAKAKTIEKSYDIFSEKAVDYVTTHHSLSRFSNKWNDLVASLS